MSESTETPKKKATRASSAKSSAAAEKTTVAKATAGKASKSPAKSAPAAPVSAPPAPPASASSGKGAKARAQIADADAAEKKTPRRAAPVKGKSGNSGLPDQEIIDKMVAEAAYYLAEKRNFAVGFEEQDWLAAKEQIMTQLLGAKKPKS